MKRRVCENCFYFEAAGLNNSGWCRHPSRQFSSDVRLVVRGNEIGCRNGWNADLWVPAGIDPGSAAPEEVDQQSASNGADQITSIVPARYESTPEKPIRNTVSEDIVVQHSPYQGFSAPEKDARDLVTNPRAAIMRAREQFKVRQKREGRIADQHDRPSLVVDAIGDLPDPEGENPRSERGNEFVGGPSENAPFLGAGASSAPLPIRNTVPPVTREEMRRPYPTITDFAEDATRFESVPAPQAQSNSSRSDLPQARPVVDFTPPPIETGDVADDQYEDWLEDRLIAENGMPGAVKPRRESIINRLLRERRERRSAEFEDDEFISFEGFTQPQSAQSNQDALEDYFEETFASPPAEERPVRSPYRGPYSPAGSDTLSSLATQEDESLLVPNHRHPISERESPMSVYAPTNTARSQGTAIRTLARGELPRWDELDASFEDYVLAPFAPDQAPSLTANLPRICRTCRDFRPADSGERGWCNNPWAFKHRRMVDADTLSCGSTYGTWWAAHDGIWQKSVDVSRHAQETPLLDRLLASKYEPRDTELRRAAEGRQ